MGPTSSGPRGGHTAGTYSSAGPETKFDECEVVYVLLVVNKIV